MNTKDKWIHDTMESLDGLQRASGDSGFTERIVARVEHSGGKVRQISSTFLLKIAAGLALLISINVITLLYYNRSVATATTHPLATEYFSYIKTVTP